MMNRCTNAYHAMQENRGMLRVDLDDVEVLKPDDIEDLNRVPARRLPHGFLIGCSV